ncbi:dTDP-glucose 4,6-dehydratase [Stappia sp. 22II-S9-Z10]|nr:dTDP-glucose 4,6-dehydratase [Stappia sp. 22II-S9-Z10]
MTTSTRPLSATLVTGVAGFIGFHTALKLIGRGDPVVGVDSVNDYYDVTLKESRLEVIARAAADAGVPYTFIRANLADPATLTEAFAGPSIDRVIHLAAQAGVRHSIVDPHSYVQSNLVAFTNVLEACRHGGVAHLTYASTSSVYGASTQLPFREEADADHPLQFYAATKRANELMAHSYSHLFGLPTTGLRFFTVYGPWGRPDMALFRFTKAILAGEPIDVYNNGHHTRDFTYVDDIVEGVVHASDRPAEPDPAFDPAAPDPATSNAPFRVYNIGNRTPVPLTDYIAAIEAATGRTATRTFLPLQPGDVPDTWADTGRLEAATGYRTTTPISVGIDRFIAWYRTYYGD